MSRASCGRWVLALALVGCGRVQYETGDAPRGMDAAIERDAAVDDDVVVSLDAQPDPGDAALDALVLPPDAPRPDATALDALALDAAPLDARSDAGPCSHVETIGEVVSFPGHVALGSAPFTFEAWVRTAATGGYQQILGDRVGGGPGSYRGYLFGIFNIGQPYVQLSDTPNHLAAMRVDDGAWHHIAVTRGDSGRLTCYVDFVPFDMTDSPSLRDLPEQPTLVVGEDPANRSSPFRGGLYMVRTWNVARTPAELRASAVTPLAPGPGSLVFEAPLDVVSGGTLSAWVRGPVSSSVVRAAATPAVSVVAGCPSPP